MVGIALMEPSIDWRIEAQLTLLRAHIRELKRFYGEGEKHFDIGLDELAKEIDQITDEKWEVYEEFYIGQRESLESLRELKRHFSIVGLFTVFENFLRDTLDHVGCAKMIKPKCELKKFWNLKDIKKHISAVGVFNTLADLLRNTLDHLGYTKDPKPRWGYKESWRFEDMKKIFACIGVPITKPDRDWNAIKNLQAIRNCITHLGGFPDKKTVQKLKSYNFEVYEGVWMELPSRYFEDSADLVQRVCGRIVGDCKTAFPERQVDH